MKKQKKLLNPKLEITLIPLNYSSWKQIHYSKIFVKACREGESKAKYDVSLKDGNETHETFLILN